MGKYSDVDFKPAFGIEKFHSKKFENSDEDAILVTTAIESKGIDNAFAAFCRDIPAEDCFSEETTL
jgi:hypothetical protein